MRDAAAMPELAEDASACSMYAIRHDAPARDLVFAPDAGATDHTLRLCGDGGAVGHDQASARALREIFGHEVGRYIALGCAGARHRRHPDAVWQVQRADAERG